MTQLLGSLACLQLPGTLGVAYPPLPKQRNHPPATSQHHLANENNWPWLLEDVKFAVADGAGEITISEVGKISSPHNCQRMNNNQVTQPYLIHIFPLRNSPERFNLHRVKIKESVRQQIHFYINISALKMYCFCNRIKHY